MSCCSVVKFAKLIPFRRIIAYRYFAFCRLAACTPIIHYVRATENGRRRTFECGRQRYGRYHTEKCAGVSTIRRPFRAHAVFPTDPSPRPQVKSNRSTAGRVTSAPRFKYRAPFVYVYRRLFRRISFRSNVHAGVRSCD